MPLPDSLSTKTVCDTHVNTWKESLEQLKEDITKNFNQMDFENAKQRDEMKSIILKMTGKIDHLIDEINQTHFEVLD
ncbi:hypothetical protein [Mammaliicoccus sp. Dog046]|uniref:hypothetical protein n=1 Tax=Mammaliicoccus sp. Dog046 TaxID=3034233 RepID=UPI002B258B38|nr:hypothetical protein [Mammaliicoccus sp. Dog046]WQK85417.1 hypothetical protein P3U32_12545 [Mammaliicoccus sp. Dog046]